MTISVQLLTPLVLFLTFDFVLRTLDFRNKFRVVRTFESVFFLFYILYLFFLFNKLGYLTAIVSLIPITFVFRDILANLTSTIILFLFPIYKQGDIVSIGSYTGIFQCLGFLRSDLHSQSGAIIKAPNSHLLSGIISLDD